MYKKILFVVMVALLLVGCTAPRLIVNHEKLTDNLALKISYDENIDSVAVALIDSVTNSFISDYNEQSHLFDIHLDNEAKNNYLSIEIKSIDYVESETQVLSTLVTLLGAATLIYTTTNPVLGFYIWWYWLPRYSLTTKIYLSTDINLGSESITRSISGFHGYKSIEEQRKSIANSFYEFLFDILKMLEVNK